jgi:penicillin-binding protein 1A
MTDTPAPQGEPSPRGNAAASPLALRVVKRVMTWTAAFVGGLLLASLLAVGVALAVAWPNLPEIDTLTDYRPKLPLRVYSKDGVLLGEFGEERRAFVPIGQVPDIMKKAILSIEDERFYQHGGVDVIGIMRAGIFNVLKGASAGGASTITQQVARNFYVSTERTLTRKIYEALLAIKIEGHLSKDQILEVYLNQIELGHRAFGFAAAAQRYFGKNLKDISIAEAAMLAGLPKAPSANNPFDNPKRAVQRQQYILKRMRDLDYISEAQYQQARAEPLKLRSNDVDSTAHGQYIAEIARQLVFAQYREETYTRGLNVYTTVDSRDQEVAYRALRRGLFDHERKRRYRGPEANLNLPADPKAAADMIDEALAERPDGADLQSAVVLEATAKKIVALRQGGEQIEIGGDGLRAALSGLGDKAQPNIRIKRGSVIRVGRDAKGNYEVLQVPEAEGAFVAIDPRDGAIRALVGGFDFARNKFNHVTQAWRQPGSSFKPFIYSAALEKGFNGATVVNDSPLFFDAGVTGGEPWEPKNYDGTYAGPLPLRRALASSKNMVSIRVLQSIGTRYAQEWVTRFGFEAERHPPYLTMALGAGSVTPMQMAAAYSVFANGGYRVNPYLITRVADAQGRVLLDHKPLPAGQTERVIDARNAFVMNTLLQEITRSGTAAKAQAQLKRADLYGKTGTTNDSIDAWFAGFHPTLCAVVWIGYDNPQSLGSSETGGGLSLPVWIAYMQHALKGVPVVEYPAPPGLVQAGGEYFYEEFAGGRGVGALGADERPAAGTIPPEVTETEKKSILDIFKSN